MEIYHNDANSRAVPMISRLQGFGLGRTTSWCIHLGRDGAGEPAGFSTTYSNQ